MDAVARQMRRLFGLMGGALRQDVLAETDVDGKSKDASDEGDFAARVANRKCWG